MSTLSTRPDDIVCYHSPPDGRGRATAAAADRTIDEGAMSTAADVHRVGGIVRVVVVVFLWT
jgi:hypothetical protein